MVNGCSIKKYMVPRDGTFKIGYHPLLESILENWIHFNVVTHTHQLWQYIHEIPILIIWMNCPVELVSLGEKWCHVIGYCDKEIFVKCNIKFYQYKAPIEKSFIVVAFHRCHMFYFSWNCPYAFSYLLTCLRMNDVTVIMIM